MRICSECQEVMMDGFCIDNGTAYYCTEECLKKNMTWEEYLAMYEDGGDTFWSQWDGENILESYYEEDEVIQAIQLTLKNHAPQALPTTPVQTLLEWVAIYEEVFGAI